jgi:hypothetical protein
MSVFWYIVCGAAIIGLGATFGYRTGIVRRPRNLTDCIVDTYALTFAILVWPVVLAVAVRRAGR